VKVISLKNECYEQTVRTVNAVRWVRYSTLSDWQHRMLNSCTKLLGHIHLL